MIEINFLTVWPPFVSKFRLTKDISQMALGSILTASFQLNDLFKGAIFQNSHILRYWELGL